MSTKTVSVMVEVEVGDAMSALLEDRGIDGIADELVKEAVDRAEANPANVHAWNDLAESLRDVAAKASALHTLQRKQDADARRKVREERIAVALAFMVVYDDGDPFDHLPSDDVTALLRAGIVETEHAIGGGKSVVVTDKGREVYAGAIAALEAERAKDSAACEEARFPTVAVGPCASAWEYHAARIPAPLSAVVEVVFEASTSQPHAEEDVVGIFRLRDGSYLYVRYLCVSGGCDTIGLDCQSSASGEIRATLPEIVRECCTDDDRARMTQASHTLALVVLSAMPSELTAVNE